MWKFQYKRRMTEITGSGGVVKVALFLKSNNKREAFRRSRSSTSIYIVPNIRLRGKRKRNVEIIMQRTRRLRAKTRGRRVLMAEQTGKDRTVYRNACVGEGFCGSPFRPRRTPRKELR